MSYLCSMHQNTMANVKTYFAINQYLIQILVYRLVQWRKYLTWKITLIQILIKNLISSLIALYTQKYYSDSYSYINTIAKSLCLSSCHTRSSHWSGPCVYMMNVTPFSSVYGLHQPLIKISVALAPTCSCFLHQLVTNCVCPVFGVSELLCCLYHKTIKVKTLAKRG